MNSLTVCHKQIPWLVFNCIFWFLSDRFPYYTYMGSQHLYDNSPQTQKGVSKILRSKCRSSYPAYNCSETGDIFFFSPIILHMPLMVDLFYYQVLKIKQRQINITTVNFSHTLELPRHMSHLDIQVFHLMTMPMIKTEMGEKECLRLRETIYSSSLQSTNIIFYQ